MHLRPHCLLHCTNSSSKQKPDVALINLRNGAMDTIGDFQHMRPTEFSKGEVPWSLQPEEILTISVAEREHVEEVRRVWLQIIETRIASYDIIPFKLPPPSSRPIAESRSDPNPALASNRVFEIAELLETILRHANTSVHLIALGVCHKWKDVALHVMRPSSVMHDFARAYPCPPVKFGDRVPQQLDWLPATTEEFEYLEFEHEQNYPVERDGIFRGIDRFTEAHMPNIIETVCYPGRITMASNATSDQIYGTKFFYFEQLEWNDIYQYMDYHTTQVHLPEWVDVTQFKLNACFAALFQDSIELINGLYEISLKPLCLLDSGSTWYSLPPGTMSYLATQFITQPPVISLNVSTWIPMMDKPRARKALHIFNVRNDDGIRVSELLAAMKAASGLAVEHWKYWAGLLRDAVKHCHPKQDIWVVDGRPKLLISLDPFVSGESSARSLHYLSCMHALPGKDKRQEEWIPRKVWYSESPE